MWYYASDLDSTAHTTYMLASELAGACARQAHFGDSNNPRHQLLLPQDTRNLVK